MADAKGSHSFLRSPFHLLGRFSSGPFGKMVKYLFKFDLLLKLAKFFSQVDRNPQSSNEANEPVSFDSLRDPPSGKSPYSSRFCSTNGPIGQDCPATVRS
ncbi:MAG: hypothetical protein KDN20_02880, partial [Verrucomicrobiae bacterium]|nr:hypothetical protein [Verrucomicrobiae bacterium]